MAHTARILLLGSGELGEYRIEKLRSGHEKVGFLLGLGQKAGGFPGTAMTAAGDQGPRQFSFRESQVAGGRDKKKRG